MDSKLLNGIMADIIDSLGKPSVEEVTVPVEAVRLRAEEMAKRGYMPTASSLVALEKYLQGYGLWLYGDVGTGKTEFFKNLRPMPAKGRYGMRTPGLVILNMVSVLEMSVDDIREWLDENRDNEVVLDDIGAEVVFNHFGGKFEIMPYILAKRLDSPCRTHATGNLTMKRLAERYKDERTLDRFAQMFLKVEFTGRSMRRARPNPGVSAALAASGYSPKPVKRDESNASAPLRAPQGRNG